MPMSASYPVGQVAAFAGVTVRTLHHYDEIGLLSPGGRSHAGHRRYDDADLDRLQRILFYRELGFPLDEVAVLLDDPDADPLERLRHRHGLLTARIGRLNEMAAAVQRAMEAHTMGIDLTPEERFEVFGEEAGRRWGGTGEYAESQRRTSSYGKRDWLRHHEENREWGVRLAALIAGGAAPDSEPATDLAEEHRQRISRWFYDCTHAIHTALAEMYVTDERFTRHYEEIHPGAARYLHDAILANAAGAGTAR